MPAKRRSVKFDNRPIGLFDSGLGGLTVVRAVREALPGEDVIYLGDTARVPYGNRSPETVELFARQDLAFLERFGIKAAIAACNTVSALALPNILHEKHDFPLGGVILAGVEAVVATGRRKVAVLGTRGTIASGAYERALLAADSSSEASHVRSLFRSLRRASRTVPSCVTSSIFTSHSCSATRRKSSCSAAPIIRCSAPRSCSISRRTR